DIVRKEKQQSVSKKYKIDQLIEQSGHRVLRLPPYNCQYNAIEYVWGFLKSYYNKNILGSSSGKKLERVKQMWLQALLQFTPNMWQNSIAHCEQVMKDDWVKLMGNAPLAGIPPIIIQLSESDSEWDSESSDAENE